MLGQCEENAVVNIFPWICYLLVIVLYYSVIDRNIIGVKPTKILKY
jgi:hypothetical protein